MKALICDGVTAGYQGTPVLAGFDLEVGSGETVALLGPSGSGKTTALNLIAGFIDVWSGSVEVAGTLVSSVERTVAPEKRSVGFVFQSHALWPHLSARDNVAYPFRRRGVPVAEARSRAESLLARLGLTTGADRRPDQLSGGQQQRVGLARALACEPDLFLFDEPTAHLDGPLRSVLQEQVTEQRRESGAAAIYSTHDATEAMAVADRIAVLRDGRVIQTGTPAEVYEQPRDGWVANLTGPASVIEPRFDLVTASRLSLRIGDNAVEVDREGAGSRMLVRPEWARLRGELPGEVTGVFFRGPFTDYRLDTPLGRVLVRDPGRPSVVVGDRPGWALTRVWLF